MRHSGRHSQKTDKLKFAVISVIVLAFMAACGGGTSGSDPLVQDYGIAYVKRPQPTMDTADIRQPAAFNPGAVLLYRELASPGAAEHDVSSRIIGALGDVKDVDISPDGSKLLFAMHMPELQNVAPEDQPTWNIWEYDIDTDQLRRIIAADVVADAGQDISPRYLPGPPGGERIVFASTRQERSQAILLDENKPQFSALDENRREQNFTLHVMDLADGGNLHQITFNQSHDIDPYVLQSGEILFSRWDNMGSRSMVNLYKINPDGTDLQLMYGAHSHATGTNGATVQFVRPQETPEGTITTLLMPFSGSNQGGDVIEIDTTNYVENTQPTAANMGILSGPAQTSLSDGAAHSNATPGQGGRYNAFVPLWDGTGRALVSWGPCRILENAVIVPCTAARLADPQSAEAPPLYSVYLLNTGNNTLQPIFAPQEGFIYTDVAAAQPKPEPAVILDKVPLFNPLSTDDLDKDLANENAGILDIRSVYDFDGTYHDFGSGIPDIATMADLQLTDAAQRPARFLRIVKAVGIPDRTVVDLNSADFGVSTGQLMREIIGYTPIEPDGSVRVKVPADVPLAISVLDADGKRITSRHQNWLQVKPGETLSCNGCHSPSSGQSHGRPDAFNALYSGAPVNGYQFPTTVSSIFADMGETMAEARTRLDPAALNPTMDIMFTDVWSDDIVLMLTRDPDITLRYSDLMTPAPTSIGCLSSWNSLCRTVINYVDHIQPLWERDRGANTCVSCHSGTPPAGELNLTNSLTEGNRFDSYNELFITDQVPELDSNGNPVFLDPPTNLVPSLITYPATMNVAGASASDAFFAKFRSSGTHAGFLEPAELRLLSEWLDIGGQYYNDPFAVVP